METLDLLQKKNGLVKSNQDKTIKDISGLLYPISSEKFLEEYWEKKVLLIKRNDPSYFSSLFSLEHLDTLLEMRRPTGVFIRVVKNVVNYPKNKYEDEYGRIIINEIYKAYAEGHTLVINHINAFWEPIKLLCHNLTKFLSYKAKANMYLTPKNSNAFRAHSDGHDVYIVQISGKKHWTLYDPIIELPFVGESDSKPPEDKLKNPQHIVLNPGDILYIPRGVPHSAHTKDDSSMHLTIGGLAIQWMDLVSKLIQEVASNSVDLRRSLPVGYLNEKNWTAEFLEGFKGSIDEMLTKVIRNNSTEGILELIQSIAINQRTSLKPMAESHFANLDKLNHISLDTIVVKRTGLNCDLKVTDKTVSIYYPGRIITCKLSFQEALEFIADSTEEFRVNELPFFYRIYKVELPKKLIKGGLLKIVD